MRYRNATFAFTGELDGILRSGARVGPRGLGTTEVLSRFIELERPLERFVTVSGRRNDPIAAIAESVWVLAGRNDLDFLSHYLPRAHSFSDDGQTWRAGYGPRLRAWGDVDQLEEVRRILLQDRSSRRAVMSIFDPERDFSDSKDIPCNNWLHFLIRDGQLHLNVTIRSNDIWWGFSGINTFEWSLLHEAMAFWVGAQVGRVNFFISSLHLYDQHLERARKVNESFAQKSGYEQGWNSHPFATSWESLEPVLAEWFRIEELIRTGREADEDIARFPDPLLGHFLAAIRIKWAHEVGTDDAGILSMIEALGKSDVALALRELYLRDSESVLESLGIELDLSALTDAIRQLHRVKDASYGNSWKKRGEQVSILANIARKVDRVDRIANGAPAGAEALIDTAVDLFVYSLKYETFLADQAATLAASLGLPSEMPLSDGPEGFDLLLSLRPLSTTSLKLPDAATAAVRAFDAISNAMERGPFPSLEERARLALALSDAARILVTAVARSHPDAVDRLYDEVSSWA